MTRKHLLLGIMLLVAGCAKSAQPSVMATTPAQVKETAVATTQTRMEETATAMTLPQGEAEASYPDDTFFPLGFMGASTGFSLIAAGGFNVVHQFRSVQSIEQAERYLNETETAGLKVIQNMPLCRAYYGSQWCDPWLGPDDVWDEAGWATFISTLSAHDNLVAWYLPDEIGQDYAHHSIAANLYHWVKQYDPQQRPVYVNPGTRDQSKINQCATFSDHVWAACYPEHQDHPRAIVTYAMKQDALACSGGLCRWGPLLQAFDSPDGGHPTPHEIRSDSYQAIIAGATGLWYYNYGTVTALPELLAGIETVADEILGRENLDQVILSPDVSQTITRTVVSGPTESPAVRGEVYDSIQTLQKEHHGIYLFAVNLATDTMIVEFGNLPPEAMAVEALFEGRKIPLVNGSFRDTFEEADVHIYRVVSSFVYLPLVMKL